MSQKKKTAILQSSLFPEELKEVDLIKSSNKKPKFNRKSSASIEAKGNKAAKPGKDTPMVTVSYIDGVDQMHWFHEDISWAQEVVESYQKKHKNNSAYSIEMMTPEDYYSKVSNNGFVWYKRSTGDALLKQEMF